jgi:hypothetical protein
LVHTLGSHVAPSIGPNPIAHVQLLGQWGRGKKGDAVWSRRQ